RKAADEFGNEAILNQVHRLNLGQQVDIAASRCPRTKLAVLGVVGRNESDRFGSRTAGNGLFQPDKGATANKKNVGCIYRCEFLVGVFATALWRYWRIYRETLWCRF
ncbi:MAG TPA: hypothetical protein VJ323_01985, partial [Bryobacteraceae bacterium]|nr:hypothetical protein [Bryobacteraceae bacterium]